MFIILTICHWPTTRTAPLTAPNVYINHRAVSDTRARRFHCLRYREERKSINDDCKRVTKTLAKLFMNFD